MKLTKTIRHNRTKLAQLTRKIRQATANNQWPLVAELDIKIAMLLRRINY